MLRSFVHTLVPVAFNLSCHHSAQRCYEDSTSSPSGRCAYVCRGQHLAACSFVCSLRVSIICVRACLLTKHKTKFGIYAECSVLIIAYRTLVTHKILFSFHLRSRTLYRQPAQLVKSHVLAPVCPLKKSFFGYVFVLKRSGSSPSCSSMLSPRFRNNDLLSNYSSVPKAGTRLTPTESGGSVSHQEPLA